MTETLVYEACMGELVLSEPATVVIAGKPRHGIVWCYPGIEAHYAHADRVEASKEERTTLDGFEGLEAGT
jgi:hypothetical protein